MGAGARHSDQAVWRRAVRQVYPDGCEQQTLETFDEHKRKSARLYGDLSWVIPANTGFQGEDLGVLRRWEQ
ncbi:hypothetical protein PC116_g11146 [Phytophthora cactorum]|nr:hypothetical protein PC116_g11146 [Phytophthora cactorum]